MKGKNSALCKRIRLSVLEQQSVDALVAKVRMLTLIHDDHHHFRLMIATSP